MTRRAAAGLVTSYTTVSAKILGLLQKPVGQRLPVSSSMLALGFRLDEEASFREQGKALAAPVDPLARGNLAPVFSLSFEAMGKKQ